MGSNDPWKNSLGNIDFCLVRQLAYHVKADSPPTRVRLLPISVIKYLDTTS